MKIIKANNIILIFTYFFLIATSINTNAQSNMPIQWQACFGGTDRDNVIDMVTTDNGYLLIGTIFSDDGDITNSHGGKDIWIVKIDSIGNMLWEKAFGGSEDDYARRIVRNNDGDYYFVAEVGSNDGDIQSGNHGAFDIWVVKIDGMGELIWEKCYGGSGYDDYPNLKLLSDGNLLITCNSSSSNGDVPTNYGFYDAWVFIISPDGEILKNTVFGNNLQNEQPVAIETQDGSFFLTTYTSSTNGMVEGTYHGGMGDVWALKLDTDLSIEWQMLYGGSGFDGGSKPIIEFADGYIFLASTDSYDGDVSGFHGGFKDIWVVRIDLEGNIIWQRCLGGSANDYSRVLRQTEDGGFIVVGNTSSNNGDVSGNHSYPNGWTDIWKVKLSNNGELEWQQCYGGLADETVYSGVIKKSDHNWVIAGSSEYNSFDVNCNMHGEDDFWVFEIKDTTTNIIDNQIDDHEIKVYPNPAREYVVFELNEYPNNVEIQIVNVFGQEEEMITVKQEKTVWDTRKVKAGIYFYNVEIDRKVLSGKIAVQN